MRLLSHFLPSPDAPPRAIRIAAARNAFLGAVLVAFGVFVVLALERVTHGALLSGKSKLRFVSGLPMLAGWVIVATSSWRLAVGVHPSREPRTFTRVTLRVVFVAFALATLFALLVLALLAFT
ncbi:MAG: hypothetical protein ACXVEE_11250 [Polyangiales bacterium]